MSQQLNEQGTRADRPARGLPYDQLVVIKTLDASITAVPPLRRYQLIINTALKFRGELDKKDPELIDALRFIRSVTHSILIAREHEIAGGIHRVSVAWQFSLEEYEKYAKQWVSKVEISWIRNMLDESDQQIAYDEQQSRWTQRDRFFSLARVYSTYTFDLLRIAFENWADPLISDTEVLLEKMIGPLARNILQTLVGAKSE